MKIPTQKLRSNYSIPVLGLGTWQLLGKECERAVRKALEMGYRHIDTAEIYDNQTEIGKAIQGFDRSELFITSKVWETNLRFKSVLKACESTLKELNTSYLDLYLIHWPNPSVLLEETFRAMKILHEDGKVRSIGVSNFGLPLLKQALEVEEIPVCVDQVEFHPYLYQKELLEFCKKHDIVFVAYSPLARGKILDDKTIKELADKYGKSPAQISLRWILQKGAITIPKASSEEHLKENMDVFDWKLSKRDVSKIDSIKIQKKGS
ncbi:MAG: aldo/keto reductase [Candidatus Aenigmarchaeota archaeon]|nr:aldo/keto reductase [Candidatus Aenigmarchaeota archaeon]